MKGVEKLPKAAKVMAKSRRFLESYGGKALAP